MTKPLNFITLVCAGAVPDAKYMQSALETTPAASVIRSTGGRTYPLREIERHVDSSGRTLLELAFVNVAAAADDSNFAEGFWLSLTALREGGSSSALVGYASPWAGEWRLA